MEETYRIKEVPAAWVLGHDSVSEGIPPEVLIAICEQGENLHVSNDGSPLLVVWGLAVDAPRSRARLWTYLGCLVHDDSRSDGRELGWRWLQWILVGNRLGIGASAWHKDRHCCGFLVFVEFDGVCDG